MKNIADVSLRAAEVKRSENETQRRASSFPSEHRLKQRQLEFGVAGRMTGKLLELGNASEKILTFNTGIRRSSYEKRCGQLWQACVTWCPDVDATQTHFQVCQSVNYWWKIKRKPNRRGRKSRFQYRKRYSDIIKGGTHTHTGCRAEAVTQRSHLTAGCITEPFTSHPNVQTDSSPAGGHGALGRLRTSASGDAKLPV